MPRHLFAWFDRLGLSAKLAFGFGVPIALAVGLGAAAWVSQQRAQEAVQLFLERDQRIDDIASQSGEALLKARRYEKDFLLKAREYGYEEARSRYATLVRAHLATVRQSMESIHDLTGDAELARLAADIGEAAGRYEAGFMRAVELHGRMGRRDRGLEGRFRAAAHGIEALIGPRGPERLRSDLLSLRRREKDFIMRGLAKDVASFDEDFERFRQDLAQASLPASVRAEMRRLAQEYRDLFREYVDVDAEVEASTEAYLSAVAAVEPLFERLHARTREAREEMLDTVRSQESATAWTVAVAGVAAILLGLLGAYFVARNVSRSVRDGVDFAGRLADGDLNARLPGGRGKELGVLTDALNRMAGALQSAHRRTEEHEEKLHRLNRTLRVLSLCNEALVRANDEAELLAAICRNIVEAGGYRVAWVGFARHDEGKSIEPVAHAGTDRDYVDSLCLTWGDEAERRGVGGNAVRAGQPMLARHLDSDPAFAPWRDAVASRGLASCLALPLNGKSETFGNLSIYSALGDAFDAEEMRLLQELADDLAYGIENLREREARERFEQQLNYQANFDLLTGLANLNLFRARLQQTMAEAARSGRLVAVLVLGLDRFKAVNDSFGRDAGDALLCQTAQRLCACLRESDVVARLAGDEFTIAVGDAARAEDVVPIARKLLAAVVEPLVLQGREVTSSASLGICLHPKDGEDADSLLRNAHAAMRSAKSLGGHEFRFYAPEMNERISTRLAMEADLRRALERGELLMHYQPKVSLKNGELAGAEALVRWQHPEQGMIPPGRFIPLAEETGLILPMGAWAIDSVCRQLREWIDTGAAVPTIAVNLSARQFHQADLVQEVRQSLERYGLDAGCLELEITESAVMHDVDTAVDTLRRLKAVGVKLSLDDFGTGYSSLAYLKRFPLDRLKIDQSFVRDITTDPDDAAICIAVIDLAHNLKLSVVAEGVETEGQMNYLRNHHCDDMQGYLYSRPLPAADFTRLLCERRRLDLPATSGPKRTLLLVDDEPNILGALKRLLRREGYEILTAGSAREGLELLALHPVQVIVSDQRMPEMNGTEFLSRVRDLYPATIRMVLSGYTDLQSVTEAINQGSIYKFLTKPWQDDLLREQIGDAFRRHEMAGRGN